MTTTDTKAIRAQMEALREAGQYMLRVVDHLREWHRDDPDDRINLMVKDGCAVSSENMARAVLAAAPDMRETILAICERCRVLEEALSGLEWACDQLASTRTHEVYLAMIDSGQADALLSLDARRQAARAALARKGDQP